MHEHYPIRKLNTWRLGSSVRYFSEPHDMQTLLTVYEKYMHYPTVWLGLGSNILLPDEELEVHMIRSHKALSRLSYDGTVYAEAGVPLAKVARYGVRLGCEDAAFLAGVPGTIGGALMMNAGAYGHSIWDYVESVEVLTTQGVKTKTPASFIIGYRSLEVEDDFIAFLSVRMRFTVGDVAAGKQRIREYLQARNAAQPIGTFNCGSVFRNPEGERMGCLIDDLGLKGYQIGYARISPKHGNFIENVEMKATTKDTLALIELMREEVWRAYSVRPQLEVKLYGV